MSNTEQNSPPKTSLHPVYTVTNIQHKVRVLDGTKVSYASWVSLFTLHARGYNVLDHIDGTEPPAKTDPNYAQWSNIDAHVLQWIYGTMSDELLPRVLVTNSTAQQAWDRVKNIFLNNKGARAASLENELINLKLEAMPSFDSYCQRLRDIASQLQDVDAPVSDQRLVLQLVRGLPKEYDTVAAYINQTLPSFETARSMIELEHHRTAHRADAPAALVAPAITQPSTPPPPRRLQSSGNPPRPHRQYHQRRPHRGGFSAPLRQNYQQTRRNNVAVKSPYWAQPSSRYNSWNPPPCPYPTQPGWAPPYNPTRQHSPTPSGSASRHSGQAYTVGEDDFRSTALSDSFQALNIQQQLADGQWFMDTGASSHLSADRGFNNWNNAFEE